MSEISTGSSTAFTLVEGVTVEFVDADALVLMPADGRVVRLSGVAVQVLAEVLADATPGEAHLAPAPQERAQALQLLHELGIVTLRPNTVSRRRALGVAAGGAVAAGAAVLVLPGAAAAASDVAESQGTLAPAGTDPTTTTTVPEAPSALTFSDPTDDGFTVSWT